MRGKTKNIFSRHSPSVAVELAVELAVAVAVVVVAGKKREGREVMATRLYCRNYKQLLQYTFN
jgi:hypothetical protein